MEEFIHLGEALGSITALMVLKEEIPINQRQCILLFDIFTTCFQTISDKIKENLLLEDKNTKWKLLVHPLNDLLKVFKEGEMYIRSCMDFKTFYGRAISLHNNNDCVEFHIHNLFSVFFSTVEAIHSTRYLPSDLDFGLFQHTFGKQFLVPKSISRRLETATTEDRWLLSQALNEEEKKTRSQNKILSSLLLEKLNNTCEIPLFPTSTILDSKHFFVRRRLGSSSHYREVEWLGESFVLRKFVGEPPEILSAETRTLLSLSHPNTTRSLCAFRDEREFLILMEPMKMELSKCIRENSTSRKHTPFSAPVAVDLMLQIARGMEYLHSFGICHGELSTSSVLVRPRSGSSFLLAKVSGFGLPSLSRTEVNSSSSYDSVADGRFIWRAPEVMMDNGGWNYTEKSDVYSFGMVFFEVVTGKVAFEEGHLKGEKMVRNIKAGERPLFPSSVPNHLASIIKRCWHQDPIFRPRFSTLSRILRHVGRFRPEDEIPRVDFFDMDVAYLERDESGRGAVSHIPFQMFLFQSLERDWTRVGRDYHSDSHSEPVISSSASADMESDRRSVSSEIVVEKWEKKKVGTRSSGGTPRSQQSRRSVLGTCNGRRNSYSPIP